MPITQCDRILARLTDDLETRTATGDGPSRTGD